jgi:hypothetical protein
VNALRMGVEEPERTRVTSALDYTGEVALQGYSPLAGIHGRPMAATEPWGYQCAPILLRLDPAMPAAMSKQVKAVVDVARRAGLNIAAATAGAKPRAGALAAPASSWKVVPVDYSTATPPANDLGEPQGLGGTFSSGYHPFDPRFETMGDWSLVVYGRTIGDGAAESRRAARLMVARMTGIAGAVSPKSGITRFLKSAVDRFTDDDLAAMRAMSGCSAPVKPIP